MVLGAINATAEIGAFYPFADNDQQEFVKDVAKPELDAAIILRVTAYQGHRASQTPTAPPHSRVTPPGMCTTMQQ